MPAAVGLPVGVVVLQPDRAVDHFSGGLVAVARAFATTYTTGTTARMVVANATPSVSAGGTRCSIEARDSGGTYRPVAFMVADGNLTQKACWFIVPPLTDYRFVDNSAAWTLDAVYERAL